MVTFELTLIQLSFFFIFIFFGTLVVTIYHKSWFNQVNGKKKSAVMASQNILFKVASISHFSQSQHIIHFFITFMVM